MTDEIQTHSIVVIGDMHLHPEPDNGHGAPQPAEVALRNLVDTLGTTANGSARCHLVLLGDVIDFDRVQAAGHTGQGSTSAAAVDRLALLHAPFVESLRVAGRAGFTVHIVAGNHDPEWTLPDVAHGLRRLLGKDTSLRIHPWILRMPGRLHAEHGNHFHDLNAMPRPSQPFADGSPGRHLGSVIDRWKGDVDRIRGSTGKDDSPRQSVRNIRLLAAHLRFTWRGLGRLIMLSAPGERRRREHYRRGELRLYAREIGLRADAATALDRVGQIEPLAMVRRLTATMQHRGPDTLGQVLMRRGARRLSAVLQKFDSDVPLLLLAHSHVAELIALRRGGWYGNPGRWAPDLGGAYPYLAIGWGNESITIELLAWDNMARRSRRISVGQVDLISDGDLRSCAPPPEGVYPARRET